MKWSKGQFKFKPCLFFWLTWILFSSLQKKTKNKSWAHVPVMFWTPVFSQLCWMLRCSRTLLTGGPTSWWICSLRFTGGCRDPTCQHKVNGSDSLTAHQSSQMFLIIFSFYFFWCHRKKDPNSHSSTTGWKSTKHRQMWYPDGLSDW